MTGQDQGDAYVLEAFYKQQGGTNYDGAGLLKVIPLTYGEGFKPRAGKILPGDLVNLWEAPEIRPSGKIVAREEVGPFMEFLQRWFPDEDERIYFGTWLTWTIRYPDQRIVATPVLRSEHGVGKGFFVETLMAELLGKKAVAACHIKDVVGDFNDVIEGKTLILIDEMYKSGKSTVDALKSFQGNATMPLRRKHKPVVPIDNYVNFIITSNDHSPIELEKGDRRFWVPKFIRHKVDKDETSRFLNDVFKPWLLKGGFQLVRDYLETVDLSKFRPNDAAPGTASKLDMLGFSPADKLEELLEVHLEGVQVVTLATVKAWFKGEFEQMPSDMAIGSALSAAGCESKRSKTTRYYITPHGKASGLSQSSKPQELDAILEAGLPETI
ncbi:hypothetical protein ID144_02810 [Pseudomonas sp. JM0905a]|nr:hypothetical protein [Pseudomonas sp. JM0905a]